MNLSNERRQQDTLVISMIMQRRTARKIIDNEETFDVGKVVEAVLAERALEAKKKKRGDVKKVLKSWNDRRARIKAEEEFRQALAKAWNKHKRP